MNAILFYIYLLIGIIFAIYDWHTKQKKIYKAARDENNLEHGMLPIYWISLILAWPIFLICKRWDNV